METTQNVAPSDATRWTRAMIAACEQLGGVATVTRESACYTSPCSYGTPSRRNYYSHERGEWVTEGPALDVTVTRFRWALAMDPAEPWRCSPSMTTGPTVYQLAALLGLPQRHEALALTPSQAGVLDVVIYEHDTITRANGDRGRGLVVAVTSRPSRAAARDERGCGHFYTTEGGELAIGWFAT